MNILKYKLNKFNFSITRYQRVLNYIDNLDENIKIKNTKDKKIINDIKKIINLKINSIKRAYIINYFFYFGVYFSFFSVIFSDFLILSAFTSIISKIIGFFGTTAFVIGIFLTNKLLELYYQDLNLLTSNIISIYIKNKSEFNQNISINNMNEFDPFINFFKKRDF